jgi:hypothetical protein
LKSSFLQLLLYTKETGLFLHYKPFYRTSASLGWISGFVVIHSLQACITPSYFGRKLFFP